MQKNPFRSALVGVLFLLLLTGCSVVSLVYDYADWMMLWRIDHYFDTSPQQEKQLEQHVKELHRWHRTHELPLYAKFLRDIQQQIKTGLSSETLDTLLLNYQELRAHLARQIAYHGASFLINLQPEQQIYFQSVLKQENQDLGEDFGDTPEERVTKRWESVMSILEFWVGEVSEEQVSNIQRFIQDFPDTTEAYLGYREFRQQQLLDILTGSRDVTIVEDKVAEWISSNGQDVPAEYYFGVQQWQEAVKTIILDIDKILSPTQRQHMVSKLQNLIEELERLSLT
jgi:Family of unknown function (DUF6279)